jgi:hypothetical protein
MVGFFLSALGGIAWILVGKLWELPDGSHPVKAFGIELWHSMRRRDTAMPN